MKIDYEQLKHEVIHALNNNRVWVLSTASGDYVTSRSMSIINKDLEIYFQTHSTYVKSDQMQNNHHVALCFNNISIEGEAEMIGSWRDEKNHELMDMYQSVHPASFKAYGMLEGQVVYRVIPTKIKLWKYINGIPIRQYLMIKEASAEQLDFV